MLSSQEVYSLVRVWLHALEICPHQAALAALTHLVTALLVGQSLRPSALMRALLSPTPVPARQRYKRLARFWARPWLTPGWLTPRLVRAAVALVPPDGGGPTRGQTHLALDSMRCGGWEVFTLGVVWHGRVLPVAWAVLPYPWPTGQVTPTVCRLLRQVDAAWPAGRPVHLVADRGFPGQALFRTLRALGWGWGWTVRLRAGMGVTVDGEGVLVRALLPRARCTGWTVWAGAYGRGSNALPATIVVGRGLAVWPLHQRTVGSQRPRAARQAERLRTRRYRYASVTQTEAWMVLCTTQPTWRAAVASYRRRWATEGSYRDAQGGWDGQHGWDLEPVLTQARTAVQAEAVVGVWALGALLQTWLGSQVVQGPAAVRAVAAQWTTTGRLSVGAHGQLAWRDPLLAAWLEDTLRTGAAQVALAPPHGPQPSLPLTAEARRHPRQVAA
jgi:hypothetical protein